MRAVWITWERQRRNRSMAAALGASLHEFEYRGNAFLRYAVLGGKTIWLVIRKNPDVIFYQNPSLILATLIATLKFLRLVRCRTVGDFHNAGVDPPVASFLVPWIVRHTDLIIVSNANLQPAIISQGGRCIAMPDPIPVLERNDAARASECNEFEVFFICSWATDEPIAEVLRAAEIVSGLDRAIKVSVTGRPRLERVGWTGKVPDNVFLTGFLDEPEFDRRLALSSVVLDLTTRADCMVCGGYEAVAAQVPVILSDNEPTRRYFHQGAVFTDNSAESIADCILTAKAHLRRLSLEISALKTELTEQDAVALQTLRAVVQV